MKTETMNTPAQVTEAHKQLVATIVEQAFRFAEGNHKITPLSQLIADSEARACDQLRAEVERLRDGGVQRIKDAMAVVMDERDSFKARAERAEAELAAEREKVRVLKLDKNRLDWWSGEPYYQFGKSHKCMNPGWWWSCGFESGMHGKYGIKNIRDAIDSAMAHSKSGSNKYNVCKQIDESSTEETK